MKLFRQKQRAKRNDNILAYFSNSWLNLSKLSQHNIWVKRTLFTGKKNQCFIYIRKYHLLAPQDFVYLSHAAIACVESVRVSLQPSNLLKINWDLFTIPTKIGKKAKS